MKYASRKFIDLIQGAASKWANWDPPKKIAVGDYGLIDNKTGEFEWEGNIYRPHFQEQLKSSNGVQSVLNVAFEADLQFDGRKRAAVLVMHEPRYSSLPNDERIIELLKSMPDILKGKFIVTEVISCAAYMMHLSEKKAYSISATLKANVPVAPPATAGGAVGFAWSLETTNGVSRQGSDPAAKYVPLYRLKQPRSKFWLWPYGHRGDEKNDDPIDRWEDVEPPWDPLDDEGEEDEIYDAEMHGDFGVFNDGYPE
ncbi:uncharacterized protein EDB91DRAFT_1080688 [Suillus paluster]|uniref:uncharacterized protein n=1 Tax=Suillus paluster TaxID=48578 RepID=UPI001B87426C|nr:uncharacterized protein EDB91DRAFT_1080688 [Suillus paluster]KAG1744587.1 hypothetical protein EDB91DRAFT_1080688 [Suillus paluster]